MDKLTPKDIVDRFRRAKERRSAWEAHWQECYDYALPQRDSFIHSLSQGGKRTDKLFDGTAPDAVEQLAASLLSQLTPPWARWFGLAAGADASAGDRLFLGAELERIASTLQSHFDLSNFAVEMHQCYLDLVTAGTASLLLEEAKQGEPSALRFAAVPLSQMAIEEGPEGAIDNTFRRTGMTLAQIKARFPKARLPEEAMRRAADGPDARFMVIEAVINDGRGYAYQAILEDQSSSQGGNALLDEGSFEMSPFINFRWLKAPGEIYGRSPVMKALPDIKTANKVVELVLKNASISVTGIWQAEDDGVLNPATIKLTPGAIIPKAVGSQGLTPLGAPGNFDTSELILSDLRASIRRALLADKLGQVNDHKMTATEVLERAAEMSRILGATYGRLQSELLTPLIRRAIAILIRRGEIGNLRIDGRYVELQYKSPLARQQSNLEAQNALHWLSAVSLMGPQAMKAVDQGAMVRWLGRAYGVPAEMIIEPPSSGAMAVLAAAINQEPLAAAAPDQMPAPQKAIDEPALPMEAMNAKP